MPVPDVEKIIHTDPIENYYEVGSELGRGKFAIVKRCKEKNTGNQFAAKVLRKRRRGKSCRDEILVEIDVMRQAMDHDRIIKLYQVFETENEFYIIIELATGGELFRVIAVDPLPEDKAREVVWQLLQGVNHLHNLNIVHMDLKPENILLYRKGSLDIKIADFGLAVQLRAGQELRNLVGTAEYVAPEVLNFEPLSIYSDMWSIGALTYALLTGYSPFQGDTHQETFLNVSTCDYNFDDEVFNNVSQEAREFIEELLVIAPKQRLPAAKCLQHPWITKLSSSILNTSVSSHDSSPLALDSPSSTEPSQNSSNSSSFAPAPGPTTEPAIATNCFSRPEDMTKVSEKVAAVCVEKQRDEDEAKKDASLGCGLLTVTPTIEKTAATAAAMETKVAMMSVTTPHHTRTHSYQGTLGCYSDLVPSPASPVPPSEDGGEGRELGKGAFDSLTGNSRPSSRTGGRVSTNDCTSYNPKTLEKLEKYERLKQRKVHTEPGSPPAMDTKGNPAPTSSRRGSECVLPDLKKLADVTKDLSLRTSQEDKQHIPLKDKAAVQGEKLALHEDSSMHCENSSVLGSSVSLPRSTTASPEKMVRIVGRSGALSHFTVEKSKASDVKEAKVEPVVKEAKVEPVVKEAKVEPVVKEVKVEPVVKEAKVEPVVKEAKVEPVVKEVKVEPVVKEAKVEAVVKESKVESVVKESKVESVVKESKLEPVVKESRQTLKNSKSMGYSFQKEHTHTMQESLHTGRQADAMKSTDVQEASKPSAKLNDPLKVSDGTMVLRTAVETNKAEKTTKCTDSASEITMETARHTTTVLVQNVSRTYGTEKGSHTPPSTKATSTADQHKEPTCASSQDTGKYLRRNISASSIKVDVNKDKAEEKRDTQAVTLEVRRTSEGMASKNTGTVEPPRGAIPDVVKRSISDPSNLPARNTGMESSRVLGSGLPKDVSSSSEQSTKRVATEPPLETSSNASKGAPTERLQGSVGSVSVTVATSPVATSPTTAECDSDKLSVVRKRHKTPVDDHKKQLKTQWRKTPQISEEAQMAILLGEIPEDDHVHVATGDSCNVSQPVAVMLETCVEEEEVKVESPDPTPAAEVHIGRPSRSYQAAILSTSPERTEEEAPQHRMKAGPSSSSSLIQTPSAEDEDEFNQKTDVFLSPIHRFRSASISHSHSTPDLSALLADEVSRVKSRTVDRSNSRRCKNRVSITEDGYVTSSHQALESKHLATGRSKPLFTTSKLASTSIASRIRTKLGFNN